MRFLSLHPVSLSLLAVAMAMGCPKATAGSIDCPAGRADADGEAVDQPLEPIVITGVAQLGTYPVPDDWGVGSRTFELYGSFPAGTGEEYRPHVYCDGKKWPAMVLPGWSTNQLNVSIPDLPHIPNVTDEYPPGTSCWFMVERSSDRGSGTYSASNWYGPVSPLTITAATDLAARGKSHVRAVPRWGCLSSA